MPKQPRDFLEPETSLWTALLKDGHEGRPLALAGCKGINVLLTAVFATQPKTYKNDQNEYPNA